jgi:hypothetical protein
MLRRLGFMLLGAGLGVLFGFVLALALHKHTPGMYPLLFALPFAGFSVSIAERFKKIKSADELSRPQTLNL